MKKIRKIYLPITLSAITLALILALTLGLHFSNVSEYFNLSNIILLQDNIIFFTKRNYYTCLALYFLIFYFLHLFNLPASISAPILAGYLFPFWPANIIGLISLTLSEVTYYTFAIFIVRKFGVPNWLKKKSSLIDDHFRKYKFYYLFTSRFIPLPGGRIIPILAAKSKISYLEYTAWFFVGTVPIVGIYTNLGCSLATSISNGATTWKQIVWQPQVYFSMLFFVSLSSIPIFKRFFLKLYPGLIKRKKYASYL